MHSLRIALLSSARARTATLIPRRAIMSTAQAAASEASSSRPRSPARIPGPVESSMQTKVRIANLGYAESANGCYRGRIIDAFQLVEAFKPDLIRISNDSSKHAHHAAMRAQGGGSGETRQCLPATVMNTAHDSSSSRRRLTFPDFAVAIVSGAFAGKSQIQRHRLVNTLLKEEFDQGLHALSLRLKTPEEWEKEEAAGLGRK